MSESGTISAGTAARPTSATFRDLAVPAGACPAVTPSARRDPPWPEGHTPASDGERRLWESFEDLRIDEGAKLTQELVATRINMSRTPLSQTSAGFVLLRDAIREEIGRRKEMRKGKAKCRDVRPMAERLAERQARRQEGVAYWKAVAQSGDSAIIEADARAVRAETGRRAAVTMLQRVFADFKAGRWTVADEARAVIADVEAFLALPSSSGG